MILRVIPVALFVAGLLPVSGRAGEVPANAWTQLSDGAGQGTGPSPSLLWLADADAAMVGPFMSEKRKNSPAQITMTFAEPKWAERLGSTPAGWIADMWESPKDHVYLPGIKKVLYVRQEWSYSQKRPAAGWMVDPSDWAWTPIEDPISMSDRSKDFEPAGGRDGLRLPIWGAVCYDAHNKEAVSFGGGGVWGRVGKEKEKVAAGDWIFDEAAKCVRRLTADDGGKITQARKWYPGHCGTWLFSETEKKWRALEQPLGQQPSGRILPGMAYDAGEKKIVLFGGDDLARCLGDTWVYDCIKRTWSRVETKVAPMARAGHAMVYVADQKAVLLAGGYAGGWQALKDVWAFETAKGEWRRLGLDLPAPAGGAGADYDPKRKLVIMASCADPRGGRSVPVQALRLDLASAPKAEPGKSDPLLDWHCKAWTSWGSLLPDEWESGANKPGDPAEGRKALAALPANTWVARKPPANVPARGWGSYVYDIRSHKGFAWGGGHSTYPGAEISEYDVIANRARSMAEPTNYNPIWLHGMVGGPPGVSFGGWSLLPSHARKSYGVDPLSDSVITYSGDVYSIKHHSVIAHIGPFPLDWGGPSYQVAYVTAKHGLYAYACTRSSKARSVVARADVAKGVWEVVAEGTMGGHDEHDFLVWDAKRDRLLYFKSKEADVWAFDFATKQWAKEEPAGKKPPKALGDGTYIPEMDAVLLVFGQGQETMYFYKCAEKKWYTAPYQGDAAGRGNSTSRDHSPIYDPELKIVIRMFEPGKWMGVNVMRLDPAGLKLTPVE
ncbi:MAG TPA: kelch repeat-containing protein [Planctomycetota bacterium]|nr:kelch repeat-containing protein [Planctomycetota bacterium]